MPKVICTECSRVCKSAQRLSQHRRCHDKKHACSDQQCARKGLRFGTKRDLDRHKQTHDRNGGKAPCPFCERDLGRRDNLARHVERRHKDQLFVAAADGDEATVKLLLDNGADVELRNTRNETSLLLASANGHSVVVRLLLEHRADVETTDTLGYTPLIRAVMNGHESVVRILLDNKANPEAIDIYNKYNPVLLATKLGHESILKLLVTKGADTHTTTPSSRTPLSLAAELGHASIISFLLGQGVDIDFRSGGGRNKWTPLMWAAHGGHVDSVKLLIDGGALLARNDKKFDKTALHIAAENGNLDAVLVLLAAAPYTEVTDSSDQTPLHLAASNGQLGVVRLLVEAGASLDSRNIYGKNPLHSAIRGPEDKDTIKYLVEKDSNVKDKWPMHHAAKYSTVKTIQLLVDLGSDVHSRDNDGQTPLHAAVKSFCKEAVQFLVENGSDVHSTNNRGETPLYVAMMTTVFPQHNNSMEVVYCLLDNGADVNTRDNEGQIVLDRLRSMKWKSYHNLQCISFLEHLSGLGAAS